METNQGQVESTTTESTVVAESSAPESNIAQTEVASTQEAPQQPAFTPNYKFKADDKDYELPEMYRPLIKDQDTQKQVIEIFEKAYGIDGLKGRYSQTKEEFNKYKEQITPLVKLATELNYYQQKGDLSSYFKTLGFSDEQILDYALKKAQQLELSPEQKRVYDEREAGVRNQYQLEQQFKQTQERLYEMQVQQRNFELQQVLSRPDVNNFVQAFDRRNGAKAFEQECRMRGQAHFALTGQDLSAEEVVQEIIKKFDSPVSAMPAQMSNQAPKAPAEVPVIPNTGTGSTSPTQKTFKSLDDVRKYRAENFG